MKQLFTLLLAAGLTHTATAQSIITFEQTERKTSNYSNEAGSNTLSLGLISSFNGYLPLYYERRILDVMSIEIGAGPTFRSLGNDMGAIIYDNGIESDNFSYDDPPGTINKEDIADEYWNYNARKSRMGLALSLAPKFYPGGYAMDGFHIGPVVEYKAYRYDANVADPGARGLGNSYLPMEESEIPRGNATMNEHMNCLDLTVQIGGMYQSSSHVVFGWGFSFGVRRLSAERLDLGIAYDGPSGDSYYINATRSFNSIRPLLLFDLKVGGWF